MKKYILNTAALCLIALAFHSCDEPTDLDLRQTPPRIVIEGQVTNKANYQFVKVSRSSDFYTQGKPPRITDAVVTVTDDTGTEFSFQHNPGNHPDSVGIYIPVPAFTGVIGRSYTLRVTADGELFEASDELLPVTTIDSVSYRINEDEAEDPEEPGLYYELLLFAREPQDEKNYYLFKYFRNGNIALLNPTDIYYSDDVLFAEEINGIPSPVFFGENDSARLEVYSLTRKGYIFYNDLYTVLANDAGGMFGPIPAPPRTNISNDALGFFQVSAIHEAEIVIKP